MGTYIFSAYVMQLFSTFLKESYNLLIFNILHLKSTYTNKVINSYG